MNWYRKPLRILIELCQIQPPEAFFLTFIFLGGFYFLWNPLQWGPAYIGNNQYGDAEFWWNGAIHFAHGIFADNPNRGFRPGYSILVGSALSIFGTSFFEFHKYFLALFIGGVAFAFLVMRQIWGTFPVIFGLGLLIFNPYTAEWISTTTTDSTGLMLYLFSLASLIHATRRNGLHFPGLVVFAFVFSLANLTRPLLTPWFGLVAFSLFLIRSQPLKKRIQAVLLVFFTFLVPSLLWMSIQKMTVGEWSISTNDASAFYAASDPKIQVWNGTMYDEVSRQAKLRHHTESVSTAQLNQEFWIGTAKNYKTYWRYHLQRLLPHFWEIAKFNPFQAHHPQYYPRVFQVFLFCAFLLSIFFRKKKNAWTALGLFFLVSRYPQNGPAALLILALLTFLAALGRKQAQAPLPKFFLASYWLVGTVALALTGGTWRELVPQGTTQLNALGYRLGSQFFFCGDLLIFIFLGELLELHQIRISSSSRALQWFQRSSQQLGRAWAYTLTGLLGFCLIIQLSGVFVVTGRSLSRQIAAPIPFPSLLPIENDAQIKSRIQGKEVFTGTTSDFIWNIPSQVRGKVLVYKQTRIFPFDMHPHQLHVDFPVHISEKNWKYRQGLFIIRPFKDIPIPENRANYLQSPSVAGFIPLDENQQFDLAHAEWFPEVDYASQLAAQQRLTFQADRLEWNKNPPGKADPCPQPRRDRKSVV